MTSWILGKRASASSIDLGSLQLAWLGDAVWELHQRLRHCSKPGKSKDLHVSVVSEVKADAQASALTFLKPYLTESEKDLVRRARNKSGRGPRNCEPAVYAKATGFETIIGWLFLNNPERLAHLFNQLDQREPS